MRDALTPTPSPLSDGYTAGWVWSYPLKAALEKAAANKDLTRAGVLAAAKSLTSVDYEGMLPAGLRQLRRRTGQGPGPRLGHLQAGQGRADRRDRGPEAHRGSDRHGLQLDQVLLQVADPGMRGARMRAPHP